MFEQVDTTNQLHFVGGNAKVNTVWLTKSCFMVACSNG